MTHRVLTTALGGLVIATFILLASCSSGPGSPSPNAGPKEPPDTRGPSEEEPNVAPFWSDVLTEHQVEAATYIIGYYLHDDSFIQVGTGFAAYFKDALWTNAHVVEGLAEGLMADAHLKPIAVAVRSGTTRGGSGTYRLAPSVTVHPDYETGNIWSPDVALVDIDGELPVILDLLPREHVTELQVGQPIATMGFPGELDDKWDEYKSTPIATFKDGTISALRTYGYDAPTPANTKIVQHNLHLSRGTSGSPIIDHQGYVIAANHAGEFADVRDEETGELAEVSRGLLDYAVRIDEAWAVVDLVEANGAGLQVAPSRRESVAEYRPFPDSW